MEHPPVAERRIHKASGLVTLSKYRRFLTGIIITCRFHKTYGNKMFFQWSFAVFFESVHDPLRRKLSFTLQPRR
jgi:hypothetical protein